MVLQHINVSETPVLGPVQSPKPSLAPESASASPRGIEARIVQPQTVLLAFGRPWSDPSFRARHSFNGCRRNCLAAGILISQRTVHADWRHVQAPDWFLGLRRMLAAMHAANDEKKKQATYSTAHPRISFPAPDRRSHRRCTGD